MKLSKLEQMPGYEKLKDGRTSVRLPKEERTATPPTSMKVKPSGSVRKSHELRLLFSETGLANGAKRSRT